MLQELRYQFDVLDSQSDFSPYRLLILPDRIPVSPSLAAKLDELHRGRRSADRLLTNVRP